MMKTLGFAVLATLVLGCGSAGGGTATSGEAASGLNGRVMRGPTMPVCYVGRPCDEPARGVKLIFSRSGKVVARTTTNQKGRYRIALRLRLLLGAHEPARLREGAPALARDRG